VDNGEFAREDTGSRSHEHFSVNLYCIDKLRIARPFTEIRFFSNFGPLCLVGRSALS
jgi:hypothetical protein